MAVFSIGSISFWPDGVTGQHHALRMVDDGHEHGIALPNGHFQQTFQFIAQPSEVDGQLPREAMAGLERTLEAAVAAHVPGSGFYNYQYVYETSEGESPVIPAARRAVIFDYELREQPTDGFRQTDLALNEGLIRATLSLERGPWESPDQPFSQGSTLSYDGSSWTPGVDLGSMDGRISRVLFEPNQPLSLGRVWIGIRPGDETNKYFSPKYVVNPSLSNVWALDGSTVTDSLIGESIFQCSFLAGEDLKFRATVSADFTNILQGEYLALVAARVTDASTVCRIRFSTSYASPLNTTGAGTYTYDLKKEEEVSDTVWRLIEAGTARIPFGSASLTTHYMASSIWLNVEAERLEGSGSLRIARIYLLPGHHRIFVDEIDALTSRADQVYIHTSPAGNIEAQRVGGGHLELPPIDPYQWRWPRKSPKVVFVAEGTAGWIPTHTVTNFQVNVAPRWRSYRDD